jgi:hypothetical protein
VRFAFLVALGLAALAACSGGGGTTPAPDPFGCPASSVVDTQAKLVSPAPGATGVPTSIGTITFSYSNPGLTGAHFALTGTDGSGFTIGQFLGDNGVTVTGPNTASFNVPPLKPRTTYSVGGATVNVAHLICFHDVSANLGSFTTQ